MTLQVRSYGSSGPRVVLLHGGPGAPGYLAPLAHELAERFSVLEPLQRGSGGAPLSVARHVADLHAVIWAGPVALIGHSWGAMLALACAAAHPDCVTALVLVGCGTFDADSRARLEATRAERLDGRARERLASMATGPLSADERMRAMGELYLQLDSHELLEIEHGIGACDAEAHRESWEDMLRLQAEGCYPAAFAAIEVPVLMLHGDLDPHPGRMIAASLRATMPQLEYHELARCGHYPWLEKGAREEFLAVLRAWLDRR